MVLKTGSIIVYDNGQGVPQDFTEAVRWYREAAEQGFTMSQINLGVKYENGEGVPEDFEQAVLWYTKAAEQDASMAQWKLGAMYAQGKGVTQDNTQAMYWIIKAVTQDDPTAAELLSLLCNDVEVMASIQTAANDGNALAQYNLGILYSNGLGVSRDFAKAEQFFKKAAEQGNKDAKETVAFLVNAKKVFPDLIEKALNLYSHKEYSEALPIFVYTAEHGDAVAQYYLGDMYYFGRGIPKDSVQAEQWYRMSAEQGNRDAQRVLGDLYYQGDTVPLDHAVAAQWYKKAAEQGQMHAQNNLGAMYASGKGVPQSYDEALHWFGKAAEQGLEEAEKATKHFKQKRYDEQTMIEIMQLGKSYGDSDEFTKLNIRTMISKGMTLGELRIVYEHRVKGTMNSQNNTSSDKAIIKRYQSNFREAVREEAQKRVEEKELIVESLSSKNQATERREAVIDAYVDNATKALEDGNHSAAFDMFKKAANEWNNAKAQFMLSICYDKGFGVDKNPKLAAELLEKSANNGDPHAQCRLGMYYMEGFGEYKRDHEKGMKWLLLSAKQNNELAQYHIAMNYLYNKSYSNDKRLFSQGLEYLTASAGNGYDAAQYELGKIYLELAQDQVDDIMKEKYLLEAVKYIVAAANQGHEEARKVAVGLEKLLR